jgi:hypothetical protein
MSALSDISQRQEFNARAFVLQYRVGSGVVTALHDLGLITKVSQGQYKWIANRPPNVADVRLIQKKLKERRLLLEASKTGQLAPQQLTIKPIRKAPAPTPMPVVDEPDYDNSNSKMLLIMAVGLVIGFLIATAIWK